jgi:hypothetical protein
MRDLKEININFGGEPVKRPAPTEQEFADFERVTGVVLPDTYKALLRFSNGGHPEWSSIGGRVQAMGLAVSRFFFLSTKENSCENRLNAWKEWNGILGNGCIPFANTGGGDVFFLDASSVPMAVKGWFHEGSVVNIASSFEEFIDGLYLDPDFI